jgi:flagellin-like hook-associated protein FlgL
MSINDVSLTSAMRSNLLALQNTASLLDQTQTRLSTGKKVNNPIDNAVNYFLAKSFNDQASDLTISKDNMATAIQTITSANNGVKAISSLIDSAKAIATSAKSSSVTADILNFAAQFDVIRTQIDNIAGTGNDASFNGTNLLKGDTLSVDLGSGSSLTVTGFSAATAGPTLTISAASAWTAPGDADIDTSIAQLTTATSSLRTQTQTLSANLSIVQTRQTFASDMINTLQKGADNLTLADMNEEGANMLALQTRQSLGITSLSLASQANQSILKLF